MEGLIAIGGLVLLIVVFAFAYAVKTGKAAKIVTKLKVYKKSAKAGEKFDEAKREAERMSIKRRLKWLRRRSTKS